MEIFVRLAITKYVKGGLANPATPYQGVKMMIDEHLAKYFKPYNSHLWRKKILWKEDIDLALKQSIKGLK